MMSLTPCPREQFRVTDSVPIWTMIINMSKGVYNFISEKGCSTVTWRTKTARPVYTYLSIRFLVTHSIAPFGNNNPRLDGSLIAISWGCCRYTSQGYSSSDGTGWEGMYGCGCSRANPWPVLARAHCVLVMLTGYGQYFYGEPCSQISPLYKQKKNTIASYNTKHWFSTYQPATIILYHERWL